MFRSQSGPGLSISTSAANASSTPSSVPPSGGFQNKPLFTNTAPQSQQTTSLFGAPQTAQPAQLQQQGGMFSGTATSQSQGGGLFGTQQAQASGNNMFGTQQPPSQQGGNLFGSLGQSQNQPNSNAFGASMNTQNKVNLFGSTTLPNQTQPSTIQKPIPSIFAGSIGQQNHQQTVPGVRISVNELRPTTRFNDLHDDLQKAIEFVDAFIINKIKWQEQCEAVNATLEGMSSQMSPDVDYCTKNLEVVQQSLENDAQSIASAKELVKTDALDARLSFKVITNLKLPQQFHQTSLWMNAPINQSVDPGFDNERVGHGASRDLVEYFSKQADEQSKVLETYKSGLADVETYLRSIETSAHQQAQQLGSARTFEDSSSSTEDQVRELAAVLREFEKGILGVATKVGTAREQCQDSMLR